MIDWLARANSVISQQRTGTTARTDETPLSSVSSVPLAPIHEKRIALSSVSSVGVAGHCEKPALLEVPPEHRRGSPSMTPTHGDTEIEHFAGEAAREAFEERAGIREFEGGRPRREAEQGAAADLGIRRACLTCRHRSVRRTCLRPVEAGLTTGFEIVWCELLPESDCPAFEATAS